METNEVERIVIKPTIGRVVWYTPSEGDDLMFADPSQKLAALIAYVWSDSLINLAVFSQNGVATHRTSVPLIQDGAAQPADGNYAEWMPYQKGAAIRHRASITPSEPPVFIQPLGQEVIGGDEGPAQTVEDGPSSATA